YRHFAGPSGFGRPVLALRLAAGATGGPLNRLLNAGGVSSGTLDVVFGSSLGATRTFPVRGYGNGELRGRRVATGTVEYRLPLQLRLGVAEPLADPPSGGARRLQVYLALASDF